MRQRTRTSDDKGVICEHLFNNRQRFERSFEGRLRRWWATPAPTGGGARETEPNGSKPVASNLTTLRQLAGGRKAPPRGAMLSGVTVSSGDAKGSQSASERDKGLAMDFILSIDAAPLTYDTQLRVCTAVFYKFIDFWAVYGDCLYMCCTLVAFVVYTSLLFGD